jgi:hypothetical protein
LDIHLAEADLLGLGSQLPEDALQGLIDGELLTQAAQRTGIVVTDEEVSAAIKAGLVDPLSDPATPDDVVDLLTANLQAQGAPVGSVLSDARVREVYHGLIARGRYLAAVGKSRAEVLEELREASTIITRKRPPFMVCIPWSWLSRFIVSLAATGLLVGAAGCGSGNDDSAGTSRSATPISFDTPPAPTSAKLDDFAPACDAGMIKAARQEAPLKATLFVCMTPTEWLGAAIRYPSALRSEADSDNPATVLGNLCFQTSEEEFAASRLCQQATVGRTPVKNP